MKDPTCKLTPLGVMMLALLREGDMHPYEMLRLMRQRHRDRLVPITNGTFYHTVTRLQKFGLLVEVGIDREGNRPERTTYAVTDAGTRAVVDWVHAELPRIDHPAEFPVALAEAHNLPRDAVAELLTERRAALTGEHRLYQDGLASAVGKGVPEQYRIQTERQEVLLAAELAWLDDFIERLTASGIPWGPEDAELQTATTERRLSE
ncbi:PadR family transcriptional regulator [Microbacterium mangrovi]|uniref:PadR family transcriptional regulator n=1 Tax=Microbacterium mangrovi TaxID=1348253 RepID=UPI0006912197|nr:PadR family transcriptional regulator [Microbacterium mangrovi]